METIIEKIEQVTEQARKILAENPGLCSMSYQFENFPVEEVKQAGKHFGSDVELSSYYKCYQFCTIVDRIAFHIRSVKVRVREVVEVVEVDEDVNTPTINA